MAVQRGSKNISTHQALKNVRRQGLVAEESELGPKARVLCAQDGRLQDFACEEEQRAQNTVRQHKSIEMIARCNLLVAAGIIVNGRSNLSAYDGCELLCSRVELMYPINT